MCGLLGALAAAHPALGITFTTTGEYDENTVEDNVVDVEAVSNNISLADFKTDIAAAFAANTGAVIDMESATMTLADAAQSFDVTYGAAQSEMLTITLLDPVSSLHHFLTGGDTASTPISGLQYFGTNGNADWKVSFSQPLRTWGVTVLARASTRTVTLSVTLDDDSVIMWTPETIDTDPSGVDGVDDTFFGYEAPAGRTIKDVLVDSSGFMRFDDMAFIVAPPALPGDVNSDGFVDIFDVNVVSAHWGETGPAGDANGDMMVDIFDVNVISANWTIAAPGGAAAVPEPAAIATATLALLGLACAIGHGRRSSGR